MPSSSRARGIVVTPAEVANEGVEKVLDKIQETGADSVAISPGVFVPSTPGDGVREPPLDIEGEARVLDRPLWGETVQYLKGYAPYEPDPAIWREVPFEPPTVAPRGVRVDFAKLVMQSARTRGMAPFIVMSPTLLPGLPGGQSFGSGMSVRADRDRVARVDGSLPTRAIAGQGCVNNPRVQQLARARLTETVMQYSEARGLFIDWAEYTCYLPGDVFTCFCVFCEQVATSEGLDWPAIRAGVGRILSGLSQTEDRHLRDLISQGPESITSGLAFLAQVDTAAAEAFEELTRFKARSVQRFFRSAQDLVTLLAPGIEVGANAFAPPWNDVTGSDFGALSAEVGVIRCKLFSFHWPMMTRWMCEFLLEANPELSPGLVLAAAKALYQVPTGPDEQRLTVGDYKMPRPDEPHAITMDAMLTKLEQARRACSAGIRIEAYLHSYRPQAEFQQLVEAVAGSPAADGIWVQRYGYLSDDKLGILRDSWN